MNQINKVSEDFFKDRFTVALFGSARSKPDSPVYKNTFDLAHRIGEKEIALVTGGGPGLMEAANAGHKLGSSNSTESIGLVIDLPFENEGNKFLDVQHTFKRFSYRLNTFIKLANVAIVMPGGIGTSLEFFYVWQLIQVKFIRNMPVILYGETWKNLLAWAKKDLLGNDFMSVTDFDNLYIVNSNEEVMELLEEFEKIYAVYGENGVLHSKKYLVK